VLRFGSPRSASGAQVAKRGAQAGGHSKSATPLPQSLLPAEANGRRLAGIRSRPSMTNPLTRNNVRVLGRQDASRTLVFVHGFGTHQGAWRDVAAAFDHDCRIVLLDNVGAGGADPAAFVQHRYLGLDQYVRDLLEVCEALELRDAVFVGHSVGAMLCVLAAIERPDVVAQLVLLGASPRFRDAPGYRGGFSDADVAAIYRTMAADYAEWADRFAPAMMGTPDHPQFATRFARELKSIPADRALTVLCAVLQSDHRAALPRISQPTLIVQPREDGAVPREVAEFLQREIAGSELVVIDATGHLPHVTAPQAVVAALRGFFERRSNG
jgi:sigma-B regulation protein RsbQ